LRCRMSSFSSLVSKVLGNRKEQKAGKAGKGKQVTFQEGPQKSTGKPKMHERDFFSEYDEAQRYRTHEIVGKGSYGVVCSATDTRTGQKVAIKKINDVFDHVSDAIRILREIKLLRLLKHPDIVEVRFSRGKPTGGAA